MLPKIVLSILLILSCPTLWANCTPETVSFYLDKGFTQQQITKLCAQSSESTPAYQPYQKPIVIYQEGYDSGNSVEERKAISELKGSIAARSVDVTETHINFIRKVCIRAGNSPEKDQRIDKCIDTAFSIARDGLRVTDSGASFLLFGQQNLSISSTSITRKFVTADPWADFAPDLRFLLQRKYESQEKGNTTDIPLRKSASPPQVVNAIRTISSSTDQKKTGSKESEVAKILDENYVPPTEEEYIASQPTFEEIKEQEKKKKKWWNPFD
ncbi:MAG: hypothetical protein AB8C40_08640 [Gammaproteobacteria bacterium]